ncbi:unnamed protein product [Orchesella dallaii]|uniref:Arrestin C-terminal-like domain-containing protein n=1 Tax=Orchesella dallaii TaxID=48710 RepID=A0ABP1RHQ4_9HEXA
MDDPDKKYKTDDKISGRVVIKANPTEMESKGLTIKFKGQAVIAGRTGGKKGRRLETYFDTPEKFLAGDGKNPVQVVGAGQQISYPFSFQLPCGSKSLPLPSSYVGLWGNVEYYLTTELILTPWKRNETVTKVIKVISPLDLNYIPEVIPAFQTEDSTTFCCNCCGTGPLTLNVRLAKGGFVPEEKIPFQIKVINKTGRKIKGITATVKERVQYRLFERVRTKYEKESREIGTPPNFVVRAGETVDWEGELDIPDVPPTSTLEQESNIIGVDYFVLVKAQASGVAQTFPVLCPIVIGTVPIPSSSSNHGINEGGGGDLTRPVSMVNNDQ